MPKKEVHSGYRGDSALDQVGAEAIAGAMQALSAASRVRLLYELRGREMKVGELADAAGLTPATASQQLRMLRHLKLVVVQREGQSVRYRLHDEHVAGLLDEIRNHVEHAAYGWASPAPARPRARQRS
jgi:ArsR family transcriptional regulator, nickel/cobalt-responsive transcriptional repressor